MNDNRLKSSTKNMIMGFSYHFLTLVLSFLSRSVFIYTLGEEYLGLNSIFTDVLSLLSMADLGFNTAMAYSFYKPLADKDERKVKMLVDFYKKIYSIIAIVVATLGIVCIPFLDYIVNTEEKIPYLTIYYLFALANVVISYLFVYKTTLLTADQKDYKIVKIRTVTSVCKTILQIVVLWVFKNYIAYLAIGLLLQFINNIKASKETEKEYPFLCSKVLAERLEQDSVKAIFENMKSVFIYKVSVIMFTATDNIIISVLISTAMVGIYSNYLMVSSKLLLIEQIIFSALTASIGNVLVKESKKKKYEVFDAMQSASFILCGIITCVFGVMINDLIGVWLGNEFLLDTITTIAITVNTYFSCVLLPLLVYREAAGLYMKTKYIMLIGAILNIILSIFLGQYLGVAGVIFASIIARVCTYFWYEPKLLFEEYFEAKVSRYYLQLLLNISLVIITTLLISVLESKIIVDTWFALIVKGMIVGALCIIIFVLAYIKTKGFQIILQKIHSIILKSK